jgi:hypothetical protein
MADKIETPRGWIIIDPEGKAVLTWNINFKPKWNRRYTEAQKFVDSEVLRRCEPYIPLKTGMLVKSGILGTDIGSGTVKWIAPYARHQYYLKRKKKSETGPLRGSFWFQRMKEVYGRIILKGAASLAGGGKKN